MIGILALQGAFQEHKEALDRLGLASKFCRTKSDIDECQGLIIPGGESTVLNLFIRDFDLEPAIQNQVQNHTVFGTCAGMIVLAQRKWIDIEVERNAYGRQASSFVSPIQIERVGDFSAHFIRAPKVLSYGPQVEVLAFESKDPVFLKQGKIWVSSFHPELTHDDRVHQMIFSSF